MITESKLLDRKILRHGHTIDQSLLWLVVLMLGFSLVMVYSASVAYAGQTYGSKWFFLIRQAGYIFVGGLLAWGTFCIPMRVWQRNSMKPLLLSLLLLALVLLAGRDINGARRWIHVGPVSLQPTELFKLAVIIYLSGFFMRRAEVLQHLKKVCWVALPVGCGLGLIMLQPDFGSFVVVSVISVGLLFLVGLPFRWFIVVVLAGLSGMVTLVLISPYRMARVTAFLDPWADPLGSGYQLTHALMAIGRGGWTGVGLGAGLEKRFYLPEAHTDFITAVIGEEFGFLGMMLLTACYLWLVWRSFSIGKMARDLEQFFGAFVASGVGIWLGIQSFFNIGVNIGLLPTKGLTLPLISFGGSALVAMLIAVALLLRVDYENRRKMRGFEV